MKETKKKRVKYTSKLPAAMYCFFRGYSGEGIPSFRKFADSIGATLADVIWWRSHDEFDRSYRECSEIRRDYLIDNALTRRFDPSFVKFLLTDEREGSECDDDISVTLKVVE